MLFIEPEFQGILAVIVERQEVKIIACSAVENPAAVINRSVDHPFAAPRSSVWTCRVSPPIFRFELWPNTILCAAPAVAARAAKESSSVGCPESSPGHLTGGVSPDIIPLYHEPLRLACVHSPTDTPACGCDTRWFADCDFDLHWLAPPEQSQATALRMRDHADRRRARTVFCKVLPGGYGVHSLRRRGHLSLSVGVHLQRFGSQRRNAVVWLHRNDVLCRHPLGRIHLSLEEGRAGLAQVAEVKPALSPKKGLRNVTQLGNASASPVVEQLR